MIVITQSRPVGFFSSFNIIVGALSYLKQNNITNFYVNWTNSLYQETTENLFDTFFYKQSTHQHKEVVQIIDAINIGNIYQPILHRELFSDLNLVLQHYNYFENVKYKESLQFCKKRTNSLGVHVRRTDHGEHSELLDINDYFHIIDNKLHDKGYENIFLTTDDLHIISIFKKRYGNMIYRNENVTTSSTGQSIHFSNLSNKEQLALDAMTDALSLASCNEIIITSSNEAGYALMINPTIQYEQIDIRKKHY